MVAKSPSLFSFKGLRRRSRASFRTERPTTDTSSEEHSNSGATPTSGSLTPPSIAHQSDPALELQLKGLRSVGGAANGGSGVPPVPPTRPPLQPQSTGGSNRQSVSGMAGLGSPPPLDRQSSLPVSQYSPRITNITDGSWVYQKVLLVHGTIGDPAQQTVDGTLTVTRADDNFPPIQWPVSSSHFKALVYMMPGANKLRFDFSSNKLPNSKTSNPIHASHLTIHMIPPINAPPLQLAIILARDSPETFDAVPARAEREGNGLATAIRKFRMAAYLWQAFTAEQMWRNKLGRRAFRFEEEWTDGTANFRDRDRAVMRSEARVHVIRTDRTVAEMRDLNRAQQNPAATDRGALFDVTSEAVRRYFQPRPGQRLYVSALLLDAHWDAQAQVITGHAALGGGADDLRLAVFGSHCLQSYPTSFEEVVPAFGDCTPTDTGFVGNDCGEAGSSWEAANIGIGAHLHETGHLFGLPHQESGVMLRDYTRLSRSFVTREAYSTRTRSRGGLVLAGDECAWHRLDCLRLRAHPCFRLPNEPAASPEGGVQAWPVDNGNVVVSSAAGISVVEIFGEGDDACHHWVEYLPEAGGPPQRNVALTDADLRRRLLEHQRKGVMRVVVRSHGGASLEIDDFKRLSSKESAIRLGGGGGGVVGGVGPQSARTAYAGQRLGSSAMEGSEGQEVVFASATRPDRVMSRVVVYHGAAVDGLEFVYDDESSQLFGKKGGKEGGDVFELDVRRCEHILGFSVRAGLWIDGIQIITSFGRKSPVYGNAQGGSATTLIPPRGFTVCGVAGSCGAWLDGFSVLITH